MFKWCLLWEVFRVFNVGMKLIGNCLGGPILLYHDAVCQIRGNFGDYDKFVGARCTSKS